MGVLSTLGSAVLPGASGLTRSREPRRPELSLVLTTAECGGYSPSAEPIVGHLDPVVVQRPVACVTSDQVSGRRGASAFSENGAP
jgi:hypothetical protein